MDLYKKHIELLIEKDTSKFNHHIILNDKYDKVLHFMKTKNDNPSYSKKQICAYIGVSQYQFDRICKDLGIPSLYRYKVPTKKKYSNKHNDVEKNVNVTKKTHSSNTRSTNSHSKHGDDKAGYIDTTLKDDDVQAKIEKAMY